MVQFLCIVVAPLYSVLVRVAIFRNITNPPIIRLLLKRDGTLEETRFRLSAKWTSPFKSGWGRQFSSVDYRQPRCVHQR